MSQYLDTSSTLCTLYVLYTNARECEEAWKKIEKLTELM